MKKVLLLISAAALFATPALAQTRFNSRTMKKPAAPMVKNPPSSFPGAGTAGTIPSPTTSTYPKPITQTYDPFFNDPTQRNQNLRRR